VTPTATFTGQRPSGRHPAGSPGGGDTWNAGFYYGVLSAGLNPEGLAKGIAVGDAATRLQQTLMFDLPIVDKAEIQA